MDIELLRTFIEVHRTRHFGRAANNLHLTQSAVSARVRLLETTVGVPLFSRERNNIRLTAAGQRLLVHAESIVNSWNRARQQIAARDDARTIVTVGADWSLWDTVLESWLHSHYLECKDIDLQVEVNTVDTQLRRLLDGSLDLAFQHEPPGLESLVIEEQTRMRLVLVASRPGLGVAEALASGYVLVDWGSAFAHGHARAFEDMPAPAIRVGSGRLAHGLLLSCAGAAYLAEATVSDELAAGRLHLVADAPVFERPVFGVYAAGSEREARIRQLLLKP